MRVPYAGKVKLRIEICMYMHDDFTFDAKADICKRYADLPFIGTAHKTTMFCFSFLCQEHAVHLLCFYCFL